jgi:hypothetical protein
MRVLGERQRMCEAHVIGVALTWTAVADNGVSKVCTTS